jgi:hypothetical protein
MKEPNTAVVALEEGVKTTENTIHIHCTLAALLLTNSIRPSNRYVAATLLVLFLNLVTIKVSIGTHL